MANTALDNTIAFKIYFFILKKKKQKKRRRGRKTRYARSIYTSSSSQLCVLLHVYKKDFW
jgi:hypothetical protein